MFSRIKRWYDGETKLQEFQNNPNSTTIIAPMLFTEYHWTAKIVHAIVDFYLQHWRWVWTSIIALVAIFLSPIWRK